SLQSLAYAADLYKLFPQSLQEVITAGEQLKITEQLTNLFSNLPLTKLLNQYAPTETHVVTQFYLNPKDINSWPSLPPIGFAVENTQILILDKNEREVPQGEEGEIGIAGACLANGYLNKQELTEEKFKLIRHESLGNIRIYKTGDIGKIDE